MLHRTISIMLAVGAMLLSTGAGLAAKRIALVIGNDVYANVASLQKAVNDARAVAGTAEGLGFQVILGENLSRREMNRKLADLDASVQPGDTVLFFYAGHGVAVGNDNFLLPTDIPKPKSGEDGLVRDEAHSADAIIRRIKNRGAAVAFVVLDACRDNPFAAAGTRDLGLARGLVRIEPPSGVFVLYSAGTGQTALDRLGDDDPDPNSVFTRKLLPLMQTPGITHVELAKRVQQQVDKLASSVNHAQQPAYYDQIVGEVVLKDAAVVATASTAATGNVSLSEAADAWRAIENTTSIAVLEAYTARYRGTVFADIATARVSELKASTIAARTVVVEAAGTVPAKTEDKAAEPAAEIVVAAKTTTPDPAEALATTGAPAATTVAPVAIEALARDLQTELKRIGCYTGTVDGTWNQDAVDALTAFNEFRGTKFSTDAPSATVLAAVKSETSQLCEVSCETGFKLEAGACVAGAEPQGDDPVVKKQVKRKQEIVIERPARKEKARKKIVIEPPVETRKKKVVREKSVEPRRKTTAAKVKRGDTGRVKLGQSGSRPTCDKLTNSGIAQARFRRQGFCD